MISELVLNMSAIWLVLLLIPLLAFYEFGEGLLREKFKSSSPSAKISYLVYLLSTAWLCYGKLTLELFGVPNTGAFTEYSSTMQRLRVFTLVCFAVWPILVKIFQRELFLAEDDICDEQL